MLVLLIFGTSTALAMDSSSAFASSRGFGWGGKDVATANSEVSTNNYAAGTGTSSAIACNSVDAKSQGVVVTNGVAVSRSVSVNKPRGGTIGISGSVAISNTIVIQSPSNPPGSTPNSGSNLVGAGSSAGETGSSASDYSAETG